MKNLKLTDLKTGKEVEKTLEQFEAAKRIYPNRFVLTKELPKVAKEPKETKEEK